MSIPVLSEAAAMATALLETAALIEEAGAAGLAVTCYCDRACVLVTTSAGSARQRAALVAMLGELAGAARARQSDTIAGQRPGAWLEATGRAGGTMIEIRTPLDVRTVPGGTLAAGPDGQQEAIAGQQPPPGWRWLTELDDEPGRRQQAT